MKTNQFTRDALAYRKEDRDMKEAGWERLGEGGGKLWEFYRGSRWDHRITETKISVDGKSVWIKSEKSK